jgi:hypothetical protein
MGQNEVIVLPEDTTRTMPVTQAGVDALKKQRELLREFVSSQLKEADFSDRAKQSNSYGEGDYGVIPGTKKRCLFKQGAEKFQKLFGLGVRFKMVDKEIDRQGNFAMFTYKAEVYSLRQPDAVIAECEASVNSQETKYKSRTVWKSVKRGGKEVRESVTEETPVCDILNTIQKMAQKRAMIGATILATGASEYFTQDVLDADEGAHEQKPAQNAQAPAAAAAPDQAEAPSSEPPVCCGKQMMVSKYADRDTGEIPWYCVSCKTKKPRAA